MVEDLVKRGRESKEVARLIRRNPPGVVWVSLLEPWLVAVLLLFLLLSLFCARRERRDDKSRALMVCVESVIGEDVCVQSTGELVELVSAVLIGIVFDEGSSDSRLGPVVAS